MKHRDAITMLMYCVAMSAASVAVLTAGIGAAIGLAGDADVARAGATDPWEGVRTLILEKMQKDGLPSVAVAVALNGKMVWEEACEQYRRGPEEKNGAQERGRTALELPCCRHA